MSMPSLLSTWPPQDDALTPHHSHLVITFGAPLSDKNRATGIHHLRQSINGIEGWRFFIPSDSDGIDDSAVSSGREYGALYSTRDMILFDRTVEQFRMFERENDINSTYQFIIDMRDMSFRSHRPNVEWNIGQKKKVQSVLVNRKRKVSAFIKERWERERLERNFIRKQIRDKYNDRLSTDSDFAARTEERKIAERLRRKDKKKEQLHKVEDVNILFENFFGPKNVWGPIADAYRKKYYTEYMPIGEGRFLRGHEIVRKDNLYVSGVASSNVVPGVQIPIREPLLGCNLMFADGNLLPSNIDYFEQWYRRLPIHNIFLEGKESEIHYLAPDNVQPDFPFVYLDWNVDCEICHDNNEEEEEEECSINEKVKWDADRYDHVDEDSRE